MRITGLWTYGDWRHVATGCTATVMLTISEQAYNLEVNLRERLQQATVMYCTAKTEPDLTRLLTHEPGAAASGWSWGPDPPQRRPVALMVIVQIQRLYHKHDTNWRSIALQSDTV